MKKIFDEFQLKLEKVALIYEKYKDNSKSIEAQIALKNSYLNLVNINDAMLEVCRITNADKTMEAFTMYNDLFNICRTLQKLINSLIEK